MNESPAGVGDGGTIWWDLLPVLTRSCSGAIESYGRWIASVRRFDLTLRSRAGPKHLRKPTKSPPCPHATDFSGIRALSQG